MNSRCLAGAALIALSLTFAGCAKKVVAKVPAKKAAAKHAPAKKVVKKAAKKGR